MRLPMWVVLFLVLTCGHDQGVSGRHLEFPSSMQQGRSPMGLLGPQVALVLEAVQNIELARPWGLS